MEYILMYDITEKGQRQYKRVVRLIWGLYILIPALFLITGCSTVEVLDGLCYNDKDGTYICPTEEVPIEHQQQDQWEQCEPFLDHDAEAWSNCMMIA